MKNKPITISTIIITNRCDDIFISALSSAQWCDEVLVFDHHSNNDWQSLSKKFHFSIVKCDDLQNFAQIRNQAYSVAQNKWVLFLDSDEIISENLQNEITDILNNTKMSAFFIHRVDIFMEKTLHHGEVGKVKILRLMKKNIGKWQGRVHEKFIVQNGEIGNLNCPLFHYPHQSISSFLSKINSYSTIRANELKSQGKSFSLLEMLLKPSGKFLFNYLIKLGFLDGWRGLIYATVMSLHSLEVRVKLYE